MNTPHSRITDELRERAQQYVLGTLPEPERAEFARHLAEGCALCAAEVRAEQALAAELSFSTPPRDAPPALRARLQERIRVERAAAGERPAAVQTWKEWSQSGPIDRLLRAGDGPFEATGSPGVFVRRLHLDPQAKSATMLIRMEPGASYPGHRHGGVEECFVLSGDLHHDDPKQGDRVMRAGDFEVVSEGSRHGRQWSEGGCLLLIRSSLADELTA